MPPYYIINRTKEPVEIGGETIRNDGEEHIHHLMPVHAVELINMGISVRRQTPEEAIFEKVGVI